MSRTFKIVAGVLERSVGWRSARVLCADNALKICCFAHLNLFNPNKPVSCRAIEIKYLSTMTAVGEDKWYFESTSLRLLNDIQGHAPTINRPRKRHRKTWTTSPYIPRRTVRFHIPLDYACESVEQASRDHHRDERRCTSMNSEVSPPSFLTIASMCPSRSASLLLVCAADLREISIVLQREIDNFENLR